jgi:hypothetical protein
MTWWKWLGLLFVAVVLLYVLDVGETIIEGIRNFRAFGGN